MFHDTLTTEDAAIFQRAASRNRESLPADYMVMMGDSTDYRAMLAREVWREEQWRTCNVRHSAADLTRMDEMLRDEDGSSLRANLETRNGEPL